MKNLTQYLGRKVALFGQSPLRFLHIVGTKHVLVMLGRNLIKILEQKLWYNLKTGNLMGQDFSQNMTTLEFRHCKEEKRLTFQNQNFPKTFKVRTFSDFQSIGGFLKFKEV